MSKQEMMLIEQGHKPAVWMSELDMESNSGAHKNSSSFVNADGSYGDIQDMTKPQSQDIPVDWAGADVNK